MVLPRKARFLLLHLRSRFDYIYILNNVANDIIDAGREWGRIIAYSCLGDTLSLLTLAWPRDKVRVLTRSVSQVPTQQLTGLEIEVEVEIRFVYTFWYLWHIFRKWFGPL